jgi:hypothetical protein
MKSKSIFAFVYGLIVVLWLMQGQSQAQGKIRDLALYDKAESYVTKPWEGKKYQEINTKIMQFVWEHWEENRLGYLVVTSYSIEGQPTTSSIFIEPNKENIWQVTVEIKRTIIRGKNKARKLYPETGLAVYDVLERLNFSGEKPVIIPKQQSPPEKYALRFKDSRTNKEFLWLNF